MSIVGRFIHSTLDKDTLPTTWEHPADNIRKGGAQVLHTSRVLRMLTAGDDSRDDWYEQGDYGHVALLEVSGKSGESGRGYQAVTEGDIEAMHVLELDGIDWTLTDIWEEMLDDGYDLPETAMGFPGDAWWDGVESEVLSRMIDKAETVEPSFTDTLD